MDSYENPLPGKTYISPRLDAFRNPGRKVRIATKVIEHPDTYAFAQLKDEIVLRHKQDAKSCITAKFFEDDRSVFVLSIQGYSVATSKPHNASFAFVGEEIDKLIEFLDHIQSMPLKNASSMKVSDQVLRRVVLSNPQAQAFVADNQALFAEVLRTGITKEDVVAVAYRKRQLNVFERLLAEPEFFDKVKSQKGLRDEDVWQKFFERNPWIFGYGLSYIYLTGLDHKKLEQVVQGYAVNQRGKRVDALLRSRGVISSLCFVEMKTHRTTLLEADSYRSGCWAPTREVGGAVSQVQGTVWMATQSIRKLSGVDDDGNPTGEEAYNYMPKSFLIVGSLQEFVGEHGVNEERFRSFELLRRNTLSPEIITFDELYDRARFIVQQHEAAAPQLTAS